MMRILKKEKTIKVYVPLRSILLIFATFTVVFAVSLTAWSPVFGVESEGLMYVTNLYSPTVSVIDTNTNTVGSPIKVHFPFGIAFDSAHNRMYVTNLINNSVSVFDTNTNIVGPSISISGGSLGDAFNFAIVFDSAHNRMYITNGLDGNVSVIDTNTNTVGSPIKVGGGPGGIAFDSIHDRIYVPKSDSDSVSIIDTNTNTLVGLPLIVGNVPVSITFAPSHP